MYSYKLAILAVLGLTACSHLGVARVTASTYSSVESIALNVQPTKAPQDVDTADCTEIMEQAIDAGVDLPECEAN